MLTRVVSRAHGKKLALASAQLLRCWVETQERVLRFDFFRVDTKSFALFSNSERVIFQKRAGNTEQQSFVIILFFSVHPSMVVVRQSFRRTITESIRFPGNKWPPAMGRRVSSTRYRNTLYKERPGRRRRGGERGGVRLSGGGRRRRPANDYI